MSRNATASWSGYAHQGKVGLLVAVRQLISLHGTNPDLNNIKLNYETQEDVSIVDNAVVVQVHQVKAYTDSTTIGSYTAALMAFVACAAENYLHTVCEITNWGNLTVLQNPSAVLLFPYANNSSYCSLEDIDGVIDSDIFSLLELIAHPERNNEHWRKEVYFNFLGALDEKIRVEHATKAQADYDISFTFEEINGIIVNRTERAEGILGKIKLKMYEAYLELLFDLDNGHEVISAETEALLDKWIKHIYGLENKVFEQFLRNINPHTTQGITFETCVTTDEYFSKENFRSVFLGCIQEIGNCEFLLPTGKPPHFFRAKTYLATSINSPAGDLKRCARKILMNDAVNFNTYESDFIINENHSGELGDIASTQKDYDPRKFNARKNMSFIRKADVIPLLNI